MRLSNQAAKALEELCSCSKAQLKKKLGPDLAKAFDHAEVKQIVAASKMKTGLLDDWAIKPLVLALLQKFGPILLQLILDKLGIKFPI